MDIEGIFSSARNRTKCYGSSSIYIPFPDPINVLGPAKLIFINERPGRIGAGGSGYISYDNNDPSADFFKECFLQLKIDRRDIFITNACLCHPIYEDYEDTPLKNSEIRNCHYWLKRQIEVINPMLIVTIGGKALTSMRLLHHYSSQLRPFKLTPDIGKVIKDTDPWIYPLFHTSRRGRANRVAKEQKKDWLKILDILEEIESKSI